MIQIMCWSIGKNVVIRGSLEPNPVFPLRALAKYSSTQGLRSFYRTSVQFSSVQSLSRVWLFVTPWIVARQVSLSITNFRSSLKLTSIKSVMPSRHLILPFSSCPQSLPASESFPMSQLAWGGQSTGVSALASFLPKKSQGWSPSEWLVGSPCSPRDSQESSPTPQFRSTNSSVFSFLHGPILISIHTWPMEKP